jgi:hypothetical protein
VKDLVGNDVFGVTESEHIDLSGLFHRFDQTEDFVKKYTDVTAVSFVPTKAVHICRSTAHFYDKGAFKMFFFRVCCPLIV